MQFIDDIGRFFDSRFAEKLQRLVGQHWTSSAAIEKSRLLGSIDKACAG